MCIGVPMQVIESGFGQARCRNGDQVEIIDMVLVGDVMPGTWVMVFLGAAREVITEDMALKNRAALDALDLVMRGETDIDHLFSDLINREPELPDFLKETQDYKAADVPEESDTFKS